MSDITIYDNGGRTADRYFVVFHDDGSALALSDNCNAPNGVCMSAGPDEYVEGPHLGEIVALETLPPQVQAAIASFIRDWYDPGTMLAEVSS